MMRMVSFDSVTIVFNSVFFLTSFQTTQVLLSGLGILSPTAGGGGKIPPGKIPSPTVNLLVPPGFLGERVIGGFLPILARLMRLLFHLMEVLLVICSRMVTVEIEGETEEAGPPAKAFPWVFLNLFVLFFVLYDSLN